MYFNSWTFSANMPKVLIFGLLEKKIMDNCEKRRCALTPQAMYNQFKRPSAGSVRELYYIYIKT